MDVKEKKEEAKEEIPEDTKEDTDEGIQSKTDEKVKQLNADTERINQAIAENENAKARQKLSGTAEGGIRTPKKEPETDEEYTARFERGEADPLGDDATK